MQADAIKVESIRKGFQNDASNLNQHFAFWATAHLVMIITVILILEPKAFCEKARSQTEKKKLKAEKYKLPW